MNADRLLTVLTADYITVLTYYFLKPDRRKLFMEWLGAHSGQCIQGTEPYHLRDALAAWFGTLSETEACQEYDRVISEMIWWRDLEDDALAAMLNEREAGGGRDTERSSHAIIIDDENKV